MDTRVLFYGTAADYAKSELCRKFIGGDGHA